MLLGQLAKTPGYSLERLLGRAAGGKLTARSRGIVIHGDHDASSRTIGRSAVSARQEAC